LKEVKADLALIKILDNNI